MTQPLAKRTQFILISSILDQILVGATVSLHCTSTKRVVLRTLYNDASYLCNISTLPGEEVGSEITDQLYNLQRPIPENRAPDGRACRTLDKVPGSHVRTLIKGPHHMVFITSLKHPAAS